MNVTTNAPAGTSSGLVPSFFLVFTPCIAVSLLVCWSIRKQFTRHRWLAETTRGYQGRSGTLVVEIGDRPVVYEVRLETEWEDSIPKRVPDYDVRESKKTESPLPLQGYVVEQYSWQTILPLTLSSASHGEGSCELGVLVRMPSKTSSKETPHDLLADAELDIATLMIKPLSATP